MAAYKHFKGQRITTDGSDTADRAFLAHVAYSAEEAAAADADGIATLELEAEAQEITEDLEALPGLRNLTVVADSADVSGTVKITGLNAAGEEIEESFTVAGTTAQTGTKIFKSVTKVELPAGTEGDSILIGWGSKLGIPYKLAHDTILAAYVNNTRETDPYSLTCSAEALESNGVTLDTVPAGTPVDIYLIV